MRFDDTLDTVLRGTSDTPKAREAAWRQIVDLTGRGKVSDVATAVTALAGMRDGVPLAVRSASARALYGARPPEALVTLLAQDDISVGAPVLRSVDLLPSAWTALIPTLTPTARAVLRHRRDLPPEAQRALESYGPVDFVLPDEATPASDVITPAPADTGPFRTVGRVAMDLPLVTEARRRENDNDTPPSAASGAFRIADIVARIEAYQHADRQPRPTPPKASVADRFRFETDSGGVVRWIDGGLRAAIVGTSLARAARPGDAGVDAGVAGAWAARDAFRDGRLLIAAGTGAGGVWLVSGVPVFAPESGRYLGHRGVARRPRVHEGAAPFADAIRQLTHELRTPTNAVSGFAEMIAAEMLGPVPPQYRTKAMAIHRDSQDLLTAIDDLDTAARTVTGSLPVRAETIVLSDMIGLVARDLDGLVTERGARLVVAASPATVRADAPALHRLLGRMIGALAGAAGSGEAIEIRVAEAANDRVTLTVDRPAALDAYPGEQLYAIDAEACPVSLLGIGFALRLARNLARELGGTLSLGARDLTLQVPAAVDRAMDHASLS